VTAAAAPVLAVRDLEVAYGEARALFGVSFEVPAGSVTTVLGANGAGKSSLAAAIAGVVKPTAGRIEFDGTDVTGWSAHRVCKLGLAFVPESRNLFPHLSVRDNLWAQIRFTVPRADRAVALVREPQGQRIGLPARASRGNRANGTIRARIVRDPEARGGACRQRQSCKEWFTRARIPCCNPGRPSCDWASFCC